MCYVIFKMNKYEIPAARLETFNSWRCGLLSLAPPNKKQHAPRIGHDMGAQRPAKMQRWVHGVVARTEARAHQRTAEMPKECIHSAASTSNHQLLRHATKTFFVASKGRRSRRSSVQRRNQPGGPPQCLRLLAFECSNKPKRPTSRLSRSLGT